MTAVLPGRWTVLMLTANAERRSGQRRRSVRRLGRRAWCARRERWRPPSPQWRTSIDCLHRFLSFRPAAAAGRAPTSVQPLALAAEERVHRHGPRRMLGCRGRDLHLDERARRRTAAHAGAGDSLPVGRRRRPERAWPARSCCRTWPSARCSRPWVPCATPAVDRGVLERQRAVGVERDVHDRIDGGQIGAADLVAALDQHVGEQLRRRFVACSGRSPRWRGSSRRRTPSRDAPPRTCRRRARGGTRRSARAASSVVGSNTVALEAADRSRCPRSGTVCHGCR